MNGIEIEIAAPAPSPCFSFDARPCADPGPLPIGPPLLIVPEYPLTPEQAGRVRAAFAEAFRGAGRPAAIVLDPTLKTFQLVDGRWVPLKPEPPEEHEPQGSEEVDQGPRRRAGD